MILRWAGMFTDANVPAVAEALCSHLAEDAPVEKIRAGVITPAVIEFGCFCVALRASMMKLRIVSACMDPSCWGILTSASIHPENEMSAQPHMTSVYGDTR